MALPPSYRTPGPFEPFAGPRAKIERAKKHIRELEDLLREALEHYCTPEILEHSRRLEQFEKDHGFQAPMQMLVDFPGEMPLVIGDAIHNLRAALDLTMCDVARAQGKSTAGIKFPFAENAKKLEAIFRDKEIKRLGPDIKKMILDMQPYKFGNISLRALHDLDIDDKHKLILPAGFSLASGGIPNLWSHRDDLQFGIHSTLFAEPVIGPPVLVTLEGFVELTEGIVEAFATVCGLGRDAVAE